MIPKLNTFVKNSYQSLEYILSFIPFIKEIIENVKNQGGNYQGNLLAFLFDATKNKTENLADFQIEKPKPAKHHTGIISKEKIKPIVDKAKETDCKAVLQTPETKTPEISIIKQFNSQNRVFLLEDFNKMENKDFMLSIIECTANIANNYQEYVSKVLFSYSFLKLIDFEDVLSRKTKYNLNLSKNKKTMFLDLDETIVYSNWNNPIGNGKIINFKHLNQEYSFEIFVRPWVNEFLKKVNENYDIYIFTAGKREYANIVIDSLDPEKKLIKQRFYREDCISIKDKVQIKDLRIFKNIDLKKTVIVDNNLYAFANNLDNGILINSFYGENDDTELLRLTGYLQNMISDAEDVRLINDEIFGFKGILNEFEKK